MFSEYITANFSSIYVFKSNILHYELEVYIKSSYFINVFKCSFSVYNYSLHKSTLIFCLIILCRQQILY